MSKTRKPFLTLIHEHNAEGQHRIVIVAADGTNKPGEWVEARRLATNLHLFACADPSLGLPAGIFTCSEKPHQVLT